MMYMNIDMNTINNMNNIRAVHHRQGQLPSAQRTLIGWLNLAHI